MLSYPAMFNVFSIMSVHDDVDLLSDLVTRFYPSVFVDVVVPSESNVPLNMEVLDNCCFQSGDDEACVIVRNGSREHGYVLDIDGPHHLCSQRFLCTTHGRHFSVFDEHLGSELMSKFTWNEVSISPIVIKHKQTYMTYDFLWHIITLYENRVTIKQIVDIIQQQWEGYYTKARATYLQECSGAEDHLGTIPWWKQGNNRGIFTDRRNVQHIISDYFFTFLKSTFEADLKVLREQFCYGISMDETFKIALKSSILVQHPSVPRKTMYRPASYCLHTMHSSVTQQVCGVRFMPSKNSDAKQVLLSEIMKVQRDCDSSIRVQYVASDHPVGDEGLIRSTFNEVFGEDAEDISVGDDLWHARQRIARHVSISQRAAHADLKKVYGTVYKAANASDVTELGVGRTCTDTVVADFCASLAAWEGKYATILNDAAKGAIRYATQHAHFMFAFLPHAKHITRHGTTANEHGHWTINRKFKFTSHARPDHAFHHILYTMYLYNAQAGATAISKEGTTCYDKALLSKLFVKHKGIPLQLRGNAGKPPYVMDVCEDTREYSWEQYMQEFRVESVNALDEFGDVEEEATCMVCGSIDDIDSLLSCAGTMCLVCAHTQCLDASQRRTFHGTWVCPDCASHVSSIA